MVWSSGCFSLALLCSVWLVDADIHPCDTDNLTFESTRAPAYVHMIVCACKSEDDSCAQQMDATECRKVLVDLKRALKEPTKCDPLFAQHMNATWKEV